jgi:hypothetical protein
MNETPRRPWWRLHRVTWLMVMFVAAAVAALNLRGEPHTSQLYWEHGWPLAWSHRSTSIDKYVLLDPWNFGPAPAQWQSPTNRWFNAKNVDAFRLGGLLVDLLIVAALIVGSLWTIERWCRRQRVVPRFSLNALLTVTASAGCYLVVVKQSAGHWEDHMLDVATFTAYLTIPLAWLAFFDVLGITWNRFTFRRRTTEAPDAEPALPVNKPL